MWPTDLPDKLRAAGAVVTESASLAELTTLRVGGPARLLAECFTTQALVDAVTLLDSARVPVLVVAGGSNLLISDDGFDGVVVRVGNDAVAFGRASVTADAGVVWDELVARTVDAGFGGLECLSGIPGSCGATPVQNVGAYGVEVGELLLRVQLLDRETGTVRWAEPSELGLGYRTSTLKHSDAALVLAVEFSLRPDGSSMPLKYRELASAMGVGEGESHDARAVRDAVLGLRRGKGMVLDAADHDTWSAGSFFTNPIVSDAELAVVAARVGDRRMPQFAADEGTKLSAGWLIEQSGFGKGFPGDDAAARLSTKHTLALTNRGDATASDIVDLARLVRDGVRREFSVNLHPEPVTIGVRI